MGRRVLVTGASGFLGGYAVGELRRHGYHVIAAGRREDALPDADATFVGDLDALRRARIPVDVVVHCAALSSPWGRWPEFRHSNVSGTAQAVAFARSNGAYRFVHISSPSVYAAARDRLDITEDDVDPGNRLNGYIRSKLAAEELLRRAVAQPGAPEIVILRPRGLIGKGDPSLVPRLLEVNDRVGIPLVRQGRILIDLTSVENVASAVRLAAQTEGIGGRVFNITNGDPRGFRELIEELFGILGRTPRYRPVSGRLAYAVGGVCEALARLLPGYPEPPLTRYTATTIAYSQTLDITAAREDLGYEPATSIAESLRGYAHG